MLESGLLPIPLELLVDSASAIINPAAETPTEHVS